MGDDHSERLHFNWKISRPTLKGGREMALEVGCTNEEKIKITANPVTSAGTPAILDGPLNLVVQTGEGTYQVLEDGLSFYLISGSGIGDTVYLVTADSDLGEGVVTISELITLKVAGAMAASFGFFASAPEKKDVIPEVPTHATKSHHKGKY